MHQVSYLYDASGNWIAFRTEDFIFTPTGEWLGWVSTKNTNRVFDIDGTYLGVLVGDRLFREIYPRVQKAEDHPGYPGRPKAPGHPGYPGRFEVPAGLEEVDVAQHA